MDHGLSSSEFYCMVCGGWGNTPPTSSAKCTSCNGFGVRISKNNKFYFTKLPLFVDFSTREVLVIKKRVVMGFAITLLLMIVILFIFVLTYGLF